MKEASKQRPQTAKSPVSLHLLPLRPHPRMLQINRMEATGRQTAGKKVGRFCGFLPSPPSLSQTRTHFPPAAKIEELWMVKPRK